MFASNGLKDKRLADQLIELAVFVWTSNRWDDFVKYRAEKESDRLYPHRDLIEAMDWPLAV